MTGNGGWSPRWWHAELSSAWHMLSGDRRYRQGLGAGQLFLKLDQGSQRTEPCSENSHAGTLPCHHQDVSIPLLS